MHNWPLFEKRTYDGDRRKPATQVYVAARVTQNAVQNELRASNRMAGDWLILRSLRSKMCLSPCSEAILLEALNRENAHHTQDWRAR